MSVSMDADTWEPIEPDQLQVGHFIKINHRWFDHPFVRRSFQISSEREIEIIREVALTRMFVDRERSTTAADKAAAGPPVEASASVPPMETGSAAEVAAPAASAAPVEGAAPAGAAAPAEADAPPDQLAATARIKIQRASLESAHARDRVTLERAQALLAVLNSADSASASMVDEFVDYLVAMLNNSTTPLALMASAAPQHSNKRYVLQSSDAISLVAVIGKRMGLKSAQLRMLTQAAAAHILGLARLPPQFLDEEPANPLFGTSMFREYPALSASILQQCGGFPAEVLRIVREHRERPDGSGFPRRLTGDAIHPLALILGAVREFQVRCHTSASPLLALAHLHKNCRGIFGAEIIGHLASALLVYPVGTYVQLSDGRTARILSLNEAARMSPVVEAYESTSALRDWTTLDLSKCPGLSIVRALDTSYLPPRMFETARRGAPGATLPPKPEQVAVEATPAGEMPAAVVERAAPAPVAQASGA